MTSVSHNCIVCANEFSSDELQGVILSNINSTRFKICQFCLDKCDPTDDYNQARQIINSYLKFAEAKNFFVEAQDILKSIR